MRLQIAAIGRLKSGPEKLLAEDYLGRIIALGPKAGITGLKVADFAESQAQTAPQRMAEEARLLAASLPPRTTTIVLDERGKTLSSMAFADLVRRHADDGVGDLAFMIGGADGHDPGTRAQAQTLLAFGPMTWPHRLVRIMLLEQLYRAVTIMVNHPYHRS